MVSFKFSLGNTVEKLEIDREYLQACELKVFIAYKRIQARKAGNVSGCEVYRQYKLVEDSSGTVYKDDDVLERSKDAFKRFVVVN